MQRLFFPYSRLFLVPLPKVSVHSPGFYILFYWSIFLFLSQYHTVLFNRYILIYISYLYVKSGRVMFQLCSFLRSLLAILGLLLFNINFRIIFYCYKNYYFDLDGNLNQDLEVLSAVHMYFSFIHTIHDVEATQMPIDQ